MTRLDGPFGRMATRDVRVEKNGKENGRFTYKGGRCESLVLLQGRMDNPL